MTRMTAASIDRSAADRPFDACVILFGILWLMMGVQIGSKVSAVAPPVADTIRDDIDPNTAPWWELATLPRMGPATARNIVDYRRDAQRSEAFAPGDRIFQSSGDLEKVRGIGPKTRQRITPYMRLPSG